MDKSKRTNCYDVQDDEIIARLKPLFMVICVVMIVAGAGLLFYFAVIVYQLLSDPSQSAFLNYILSQLPAPASPTFTINGVVDGKQFQMTFPTDVLVYSRYVFAFVIWGILGGLAGTLLRGGISIYRGLTRTTK
jgi:hypothetical protein